MIGMSGQGNAYKRLQSSMMPPPSIPSGAPNITGSQGGGGMGQVSSPFGSAGMMAPGVTGGIDSSPNPFLGGGSPGMGLMAPGFTGSDMPIGGMQPSAQPGPASAPPPGIAGGPEGGPAMAPPPPASSGVGTQSPFGVTRPQAQPPQGGIDISGLYDPNAPVSNAERVGTNSFQGGNAPGGGTQALGGPRHGMATNPYSTVQGSNVVDRPGIPLGSGPRNLNYRPPASDNAMIDQLRAADPRMGASIAKRLNSRGGGGNIMRTNDGSKPTIQTAKQAAMGNTRSFAPISASSSFGGFGGGGALGGNGLPQGAAPPPGMGGGMGMALPNSQPAMTPLVQTHNQGGQTGVGSGYWGAQEAINTGGNPTYVGSDLNILGGGLRAGADRDLPVSIPEGGGDPIIRTSQFPDGLSPSVLSSVQAAQQMGGDLGQSGGGGSANASIARVLDAFGDRARSNQAFDPIPAQATAQPAVGGAASTGGTESWIPVPPPVTMPGQGQSVGQALADRFQGGVNPNSMGWFNQNPDAANWARSQGLEFTPSARNQWEQIQAETPRRAAGNTVGQFDNLGGQIGDRFATGWGINSGTGQDQGGTQTGASGTAGAVGRNRVGSLNRGDNNVTLDQNGNVIGGGGSYGGGGGGQGGSDQGFVQRNEQGEPVFGGRAMPQQGGNQTNIDFTYSQPLVGIAPFGESWGSDTGTGDQFSISGGAGGGTGHSEQRSTSGSRSESGSHSESGSTALNRLTIEQAQNMVRDTPQVAQLADPYDKTIRQQEINQIRAQIAKQTQSLAETLQDRGAGAGASKGSAAELSMLSDINRQGFAAQNEAEIALRLGNAQQQRQFDLQRQQQSAVGNADRAMRSDETLARLIGASAGQNEAWSLANQLAAASAESESGGFQDNENWNFNNAYAENIRRNNRLSGSYRDYDRFLTNPTGIA